MSVYPAPSPQGQSVDAPAPIDAGIPTMQSSQSGGVILPTRSENIPANS